MHTTRHRALGLALLMLLLTGCGTAAKPKSILLQRLDPKAPAAHGRPPVPGADGPAPIVDQTPFGLYAVTPSHDTLVRLSTGTLSPDGQFRMATTDQGAWVTRADGAWIWQVQLTPPPAQPAAPAPATTPAGKPAPPPPPQATKITGSLEWTPQNTLLFKDDLGRWHQAKPETTQESLLPAALQGKDDLAFSPDGQQVLYTVPTKTGRQLWVAKADGTAPKFLGDNVIGYWDAAGKPAVRRADTGPIKLERPMKGTESVPPLTGPRPQ